MAGGPLFPFSVVPVSTSNAYPDVFDGTGGNSELDYGLGVGASLSSDVWWDLRFAMPPTLPSGTAKLVLLAMANATTGNAKVNPKWVSVARTENPSSAALNAEGTTTLAWGASDAEDYKEAKITLDADTVVADEIVVMRLVFESTSWTLAAASVWRAFMVWE